MNNLTEATVQQQKHEEGLSPIKDNPSNLPKTQTYTCPVCGNNFAGTNAVFCSLCGQQLNWDKTQYTKPTACGGKCSSCYHKSVCKLKKSYNYKIEKDNVPNAFECQNYVQKDLLVSLPNLCKVGQLCYCVRETLTTDSKIVEGTVNDIFYSFDEKANKLIPIVDVITPKFVRGIWGKDVFGSRAEAEAAFTERIRNA